MTTFKRNDFVTRLTDLDDTMKAGDVHNVREVTTRGALILLGREFFYYDPAEFRLATEDEINGAIKP